jgi:hypothetical protein
MMSSCWCFLSRGDSITPIFHLPVFNRKSHILLIFGGKQRFLFWKVLGIYLVQSHPRWGLPVPFIPGPCCPFNPVETMMDERAYHSVEKWLPLPHSNVHSWVLEFFSFWTILQHVIPFYQMVPFQIIEDNYHSPPLTFSPLSDMPFV